MEIEQDEEKGLISRQQEFKIRLNNLSYSVPERKGRSKCFKQLLQNINAEFKSGHLTAVLGPSGAGKTTFLNIVSGFRTSRVEGSVMLNDQEQHFNELRSISSYIPQEFDMHPLLTTRETLLFAANLKLKDNIGMWKKFSRVNEILDILGLSKVTNNSVGRLSGGEKKRLSIGIELLTKPPIMLFDEPTSGLDSSASFQLISHLKSLAQSGMIIICSIHQPSSRLFEMFDDVVVLSEGQCFYSGPLRRITDVFGEAGFQCPNFYNPADFVIEVVSRERGDDITSLQNVLKQHEKKEIPEKDGLNADMIGVPKQDIIYKNSKENVSNYSLKSRCITNKYHYPVRIHMQFGILLKRAFLCSIRDMHMAWLRTSAHIVVALLLGALYYGLGDEASKTSSNVACIFFFVMFLFFSNSMPTILTFPTEASVFRREYLNNWYSLSAYYTAKLFAEVPLQVLCPTLFVCIGYYLTSQPYEERRFLQFWLICLLTVMVGQLSGLVIGAAFDAQLGVFLVPASSIPMILFSGFFMKLQDFPWYFEWLTYVSYFRYAFDGAMLCIYGYNRKDLKCSIPYCHFKNSKKILEEFGMQDSSYTNDIIGLVIWIALLQVALFIALKFSIKIRS